MPIYEYRCTSCQDDFEVNQKISDAPLSACPKCHGSLEKLISQSSFVLKGSGWYMTDYGRKGAGKEAPKGAKEATKDAGGCASSGSTPACAGCPSSAD